MPIKTNIVKGYKTFNNLIEQIYNADNIKYTKILRIAPKNLRKKNICNKHQINIKFHIHANFKVVLFRGYCTSLILSSCAFLDEVKKIKIKFTCFANDHCGIDYMIVYGPRKLVFVKLFY